MIKLSPCKALHITWVLRSVSLSRIITPAMSGRLAAFYTSFVLFSMLSQARTFSVSSSRSCRTNKGLSLICTRKNWKTLCPSFWLKMRKGDPRSWRSCACRLCRDTCSTSFRTKAAWTINFSWRGQKRFSPLLSIDWNKRTRVSWRQLIVWSSEKSNVTLPSSRISKKLPLQPMLRRLLGSNYTRNSSQAPSVVCWLTRIEWQVTKPCLWELFVALGRQWVATLMQITAPCQYLMVPIPRFVERLDLPCSSRFVLSMIARSSVVKSVKGQALAKTTSRIQRTSKLTWTLMQSQPSRNCPRTRN